MGKDKDINIPLVDKIIDPSSLEGSLPKPARDILAGYYNSLQAVARRNFPLKTPLNINLIYQPRTIPINQCMHPVLPLFEAPYLITTGILNGDIKADPQLAENESYYRELVGLSFVKVLEVMHAAQLGVIDWAPPKERRLRNGRECYEVTATREDEFIGIDYVPSRRELSINWYDQNPRVTAVGKPVGFRSLRAGIRIDSEVYTDNPAQASNLRMDFVVSELEWGEQPDQALRVIKERRLTDDLLGINRHHVPIAIGQPVGCLIMTGIFMKFLNVAFLKPAERRVRSTSL